jgi:hypothetical protein
MSTPARFNRKQFLTWSLSSSAVVALGCSSDPEPYSPSGAGAASGGAPGAGAGGASAGSAGVAATGAPSAGAGGASAGSSGAAGGSVGGSSAGGSSGAAGSGGAAAGAGGIPVTADCGSKMKTLITANHGHVVDISLADVMVGVTKVYDTKGTSNHEHWIQLTAADFSKLKNGGVVRKLSCNDGHEQEYIVNCVADDAQSPPAASQPSATPATSAPSP